MASVATPPFPSVRIAAVLRSYCRIPVFLESYNSIHFSHKHNLLKSRIYRNVRMEAMVKDGEDLVDGLRTSDIEMKEPSIATVLTSFSNSFDPYSALSTPLYQTATFNQISGADFLTTSQNDSNSISSLNDTKEIDWIDLEEDLFYWTKPVRPVQWYPGHIAKTEKELKDQLKLMDVVIEVRDARIPLATSHPQMDLWMGNRKKILVLNREDMISSADRNAWGTYFARQGVKVIFANGQFGMGTMKLGRLARALALSVNVRRREKGLLPRPVRAGVVGYPNVGKSSLINRLLKRRKCAAAPRPGVTRELKWVHFGSDLELLDSPGILPMRISDQVAAIKLAICDDIGERSYDVCDVAVILVQMLCKLPGVGSKSLYNRYRINTDGSCGRTFIDRLSLHMFGGNVNQAAFRILTDYRKGKFGWFALERPPK